jgi:alcohol dehydrogenase
MNNTTIDTAWDYFSPIRIKFGTDCIRHINSYLKIFNANKIALIVDKTLMEIGIIDNIVRYIEDYSVGIFSDVEPYPSLGKIENALKFVKDGSYDLIIGIGGGSSIDIAKIVAVLANKPGIVEDYIFDDSYRANPTKVTNREITKPGIPFVAVPTTAGTGSEVVMWSVIWDIQKKTKQSLSHPLMFSSLVIIDPSLTLTLPRKVLASAGIDAFCHAIEAYWSLNENQITLAHSLDAIRLIFSNLEKSYYNSDIEYRENMSKANLLAGLALSSAKTNSSHSMGYSLTQYFNVPHGAASAIFLPALFEFNFDIMGEKAKILSKLLDIKSGLDGKKKIRKMMKNIGLPIRLRDIGVKKTDFDFIIEKGFIPFRMADNPRQISKKDINKIVIESY